MRVMMIIRTLFVCVICCIAIGCSSGSGLMPIVPTSDETGQSGSLGNHEIPSEIPQAPVLISDFDSNGKPSGGMGVMGLFHGTINPSTGFAELLPIRTSSSNDALEIVDITNFLSIAPCHDCAKITGISLDSDENVVLKISIKHPFPTGDPNQKVTGRNRLDLAVFNVEGQFYSDWEGATATAFAQIGASVHLNRVLNADGYSSYLSQYINDQFPTGATLHPYKLFFDDYSVGNYDPFSPYGFTDIMSPKGNLVMRMGSDYDTQDYVLNIDEDENLDFIFAIGATYGISADSKSRRFTPIYRVPQFNKKAASELSIEVLNNSLIENDLLSTATIVVKVLDMNHGVNIGSDLNDMKELSNVSTISVEVPGVTNGAVTDTNPVSAGGDPRSPSNPLKFEVEIKNDLADGTNWGNHWGLVKVKDSYPPASNASPLLAKMDGIRSVDPIANPLSGLFAISEFATYQVFEIWVEPSQPHPVCDFHAISPTTVYSGGVVYFDATASYDPNGIIVSYLWDFDDDRNFGDSFDEGTPSRPGKRYITPGIYDVSLRLIDNESGWSECTEERVTVSSNIPPNCSFINTTGLEIYEGYTVTFDASASNDPDGVVVDYQWDFNGDNIYNDSHDGPNYNPTERFDDPGTYDVKLKVIDNRQAASYCGPITVIVKNIQQFSDPDENPTPPSMVFGDINNPVFHCSLASKGDTVFVAFGGQVSLYHSYFVMMSSNGGNSWGPAVLVSGNSLDNYTQNISEGIAVAIANSNPPRPIVAWIDTGYDLVYAYGSSDGSSWQVVRGLRDDDSPVFDVSIAADPTTDSNAYITLRDSSYFNRDGIMLLGISNCLGIPWKTQYRVDDDVSINISHLDPNLAVGPTGNVFVVYAWNTGVTSDEIRLRKYIGSSPSTLTPNEIQRVDNGGTNRMIWIPTVDVLSNDNPVVVFQDNSFDPSSPYDIDVAINIGTGTTPTFGNKSRLNDGTTHANSSVIDLYDQRHPVVRVNRATDIIWVVYQDNRDSYFNPQIYYTVRTSDLTLIEEDNVTQSDPSLIGRHSYPHLSIAQYIEDSKVYVLWQDRNASLSSNFRFQIAQ